MAELQTSSMTGAEAQQTAQRVTDAYETRYFNTPFTTGELTNLPLTLGCATVVCP